MPASTFPPSAARWLRRALLPVAAAAVLAGCGGGDRVDPFKPSKIYVFGDEYSYIAPSSSANAGLKYTVNTPTSPQAANPPQTFACALNPLWVQWLVNDHYNKDLDACPIGNEATPSATLQAQPGWKTQDVLNALAGRTFAKGDLVVVFIGANDVRDTTVDVTAQGAALGRRLRDIAGTGANVLVVNLPLLGINDRDGGDATLRSRRIAFNDALRSSNGLGTVDGRRVALLQSDARLENVFVNGNNTALRALVCPAATAATQCYVAYTDSSGGGSASVAGTNTGYADALWSFDIWLSPAGHQLIGNAARSQVNSNWE